MEGYFVAFSYKFTEIQCVNESILENICKTCIVYIHLQAGNTMLERNVQEVFQKKP